MAGEDIGDSAAVSGGAILVESGPSSGGGDMRRQIEQLKEELLMLKRKHGEPQVKGPDPPVVCGGPENPDLVEIGNSQLGQAERVGDGDHLVEEPARVNPGPRMFTSAESDHARSWIPKPEIYDGTNPVNEYLTHFEEVSRINGWSSEMKRNYLGVSLRGAAQALLHDVGPDCVTYNDLVKFLRQRFQPDEQRALYKVQLKNRRRKPGEKLDELAQSILKLARNAFPHAPNEWRETAAKDQFIEALTDADLRRQVYSMFPKTLNDALAGAVQLEAFYQDERSRNSRKQIVRTVEGANVSDQSQHEFKGSIGPCWECGLMGHYRSRCPTRRHDFRARNAWRPARSGNEK